MLPIGIRQKVWNRIEMLGEPIAAEVHASAPHLRRWICIYAIKDKDNLSSLARHPLHSKYQVYDFELVKEKLAEYEGDEDLLITSENRHYLNSISELNNILKKLKIDPASFDAPWHVEYPL